MENPIEGSAWTFGDNINTDIISPPQYMELSIEEAAPYAMSAVSQNFAKAVKQGDIFVAGNNLGSGSSRETSPLTLKYLGIEAVVACSFARIFYRNCINLGIPAIECADSRKIQDQDQITVLVEEGYIINHTRQEQYSCSLLPENILTMIQAGGLVPYLIKKRAAKGLTKQKENNL